MPTLVAIYKIRRSEFVPGTPYTAAVGAPDSSGASVGFVGILDLNFGELLPIVTGLQSPHGMGFVKNRSDEWDEREAPARRKTDHLIVYIQPVHPVSQRRSSETGWTANPCWEMQK